MCFNTIITRNHNICLFGIAEVSRYRIIHWNLNSSTQICKKIYKINKKQMIQKHISHVCMYAIVLHKMQPNNINILKTLLVGNVANIINKSIMRIRYWYKSTNTYFYLFIYKISVIISCIWNTNMIALPILKVYIYV